MLTKYQPWLTDNSWLVDYIPSSSKGIIGSQMIVQSNENAESTSPDIDLHNPDPEYISSLVVAIQEKYDWSLHEVASQVGIQDSILKQTMITKCCPYPVQFLLENMVRDAN